MSEAKSQKQRLPAGNVPTSRSADSSSPAWGETARSAVGTRQLREAWNSAADGYEEYFAPRFRPWQADLLRAAIGDELPSGPVLVPCCGPGLEVEALADAMPERHIVAIDLSERMIALTERRCARLSNVEARVGDAAELPGPAALIVSAFGLQQMPDPPDVVAAWTRALAPGGIANVLFWPRVVEDEGPFALARAVAAAKLGAPPGDWETKLAASIEGAGGRVLADDTLVHTMTHDSAETVFARLCDAGPWRALRLRIGDEQVAELRRELVRRSPAGAITHHPRARLLRFTRSA